jgi:hypothetical protein
MTDQPYPWEPPVAGSEAAQLVGALERLRMTFRWKTADLDETGLRTTIGSSALTLGNLLKHLAFAEDYKFTVALRGEQPGGLWPAGVRPSSDWTFASAAAHSPDELYAMWDGAVARSRRRLSAALADGGLGQLVHMADADGRHANLRRLVCDLIEEYGRHTGHADLIREAVDGRVGEDPPANWRP